MYTYEDLSLKAFAEDTRIQLPRFQRKETWDESRNFILAVTIYMNYPLGVVVLNRTDDKKSGPVKWLLDGRQRRTAIQKMLENPENIYDWAKDFLGIKNKHTATEITESFWEKVRTQLGTDESNSYSSDGDTATQVEQEDSEPTELTDEEKTVSVIHPKKNSEYGELDDLLEIILIVHSRSKKWSEFSRPFFFKKADSLDWVEAGKRLNGKELTKHLSKFIDKNTDKSQWTAEKFAEFIISEHRLNRPAGKENVTEYIKDGVKKNWSLIQQRLNMVMKISDRLDRSKIGLVNLTNASLRDAQYAFKIINTAGVELSSAEVASADPYWNIKVDCPSVMLKEISDKMYKVLGVSNKGEYVRWDVPATLLNLFDQEDAFRLFNKFSTNAGAGNKSSKQIEESLNFGFKLMSSIYYKSVNRTEIDKLAKDGLKIDWDRISEEVTAEFTNINRCLTGHSYFSTMKKWDLDLKGRFGDTPSIYLATLLLTDWRAKSLPTTGRQSKEHKAFIYNAFVAYDRLVYEYITKAWKSASDTVLKRKLEAGTAPNFLPVSEAEWTQLLTEMFDNHSVSAAPLGDKPVDTVFDAFLSHFICVLARGIEPEDVGSSFSIDHMIPQSDFSSKGAVEKSKGIKLANLIPVPSRLNSQKTDKYLYQLTESDGKRYASYIGADYQKLRDIKNCTHFEQLGALLRPIYIDTFLEKRREAMLIT